MYRFTDYFDQDKINEPYGSTEEEVQDYLRLLDMLLEGYLEFKGLASEEKLFSRGLVITESEMRSYFRKSPSKDSVISMMRRWQRMHRLHGAILKRAPCKR